MKIVHINTTDNRGGAAHIALLLHRELNKIPGISSHMLVREKNTSDPTIDKVGVSGLRRWLSILLSEDFRFLGGHSLLEHQWIKEADIIHLHNLHGYYFHLPFLKELAENKKIIWTLHDMWTMTGHCGISIEETPDVNGLYKCKGQFEYVPLLLPRASFLGKLKIRILQSLAITYVTPSKWLQEKVKLSYLKDKNVQIIHNGIDISIFSNKKNQKEIYKEELKIPKNKKIILFVANSFSDPMKGGKTIKKLIKDIRFNDVTFVAIGNGKLPKQQNLLRISYTTNKELLAKYYCIADVFLHPALRDNFPTAIMESLSCHTPVVAYKVGGIPEQLYDETGMLVPFGDYELFIQKTLSLLERTDDISFKTIDFSKETMAKNYLALYKRL